VADKGADSRTLGGERQGFADAAANMYARAREVVLAWEGAVVGLGRDVGGVGSASLRL
jgi:hypothetical protein